MALREETAARRLGGAGRRVTVTLDSPGHHRPGACNAWASHGRPGYFGDGGTRMYSMLPPPALRPSSREWPSG